MAITIKDVAQLVNVAPSTVSRVIANDPRISEKTKVRVRKAMENLGYHPNFIARSLANQTTRIIGLVLPSSSNVFYQNPFFPAILQGLSEGAQEKHYSLLLSTGKTEEEIYERVVNMVQGGMVDGIILMYSRMNDHILTYLRARAFPFVIIGKPYDFIEEITYVDYDNVLVAEQATDYLIQLGHERIGFIGGDITFVMTLDRLLGYERALKRAGIVPRREYTIHEDFLHEGGQAVAKRLLSIDEPPTALVVSEDLMALGVVHCLREMGVRTPDEISIVSFNHVLFSKLSLPALTSVDINIFDLGYKASKIIIQKLQTGDTTAGSIIPHHFVERHSCKSIKQDAMALTY
ncbi:LacI family DNA-binding transcriptional regulator [Peribacillus simplex]|uniref:LacI family DNA-binding transcriptional regulator n=1 Tax=Peribacillus simplex TaxID=1478 RepID=UPI00298DC9FD|nr:LacI family DNA-binding transcriptional regulator [Peribacillus simplex]MDW7617778.1 LacI family DNA-binding transcriptional regulator [Peribacillus simplex]